jgi:hypothetical protein
MPVVTELSPFHTEEIVELALADARAALLMVRDDPEARMLAVSTPTKPDVNGALGQWLYRAWWSAVRTNPGPPGSTSAGAAALEATRRTVAPTSPGWLVLAATASMIVAGHQNTGKHITAAADAVLGSSRPGMPPRPGDLVSLVAGSSSLEASKGWWQATTGSTRLGPGVAIDRWYLHAADLDAALAVVPLLLKLFFRLDCDASLKCPPTDSLYGRRDALVVYLPRASSARAEAALPSIADRLAKLLLPDVPPLTRPLLPGLATAQDPGGAISYGQLRCAQLAAIAGHSDPDCSDDELVTRLAGVGINPRSPEMVTG